MDLHNKSNNSNSIEVIFDSSLNLEQTHLKEGYDEGYTHGLATRKEEAKDVGLKHGFETGEELGFYKASIRQMDKLNEKYPVSDPENENIQEIMEALKLKFRIIRAALGVKLEYDG
ncbi:Yae1 N domain-containing protein [Citrus sinensis]|nr:Yae1 N domain-containing protein [Citrus sinensis]